MNINLFLGEEKALMATTFKCLWLLLNCQKHIISHWILATACTDSTSILVKLKLLCGAFRSVSFPILSACHAVLAPYFRCIDRLPKQRLSFFKQMRAEIILLSVAAATVVHGTPVPEVMGYSTLEPGFSTTIDYDLADFDEFGIDPGAADTINFATDAGQGLELGYPNTGLSEYSSFGTGFDSMDMRLTGDALSDEDMDAVETSTDDGTLDAQGMTQTRDNNDNQDDIISTTPDVDDQDNQDDISSTVSTPSSTIDSTSFNEMTTADSIANNGKNDVSNQNMRTSSVPKKKLSDEEKSSADQSKTDLAEMTSAESFMSASNIDLSLSYRTNETRSFSGNKESRMTSSKNASENNISDSNADTNDIDADINDQSDISTTVDGTSNTNSLADSSGDTGSGSQMSLTLSTGLTASEDGKTGAYSAKSDQNSTENIERNTLSETDRSNQQNSDDSGKSNTTEDDINNMQTNAADDTEQSSATSDNTADEIRTSETNRLYYCFGEETVTSNVCNIATSLHTICMYQFSNECNQGQKVRNDLSSATAESVKTSGKSSLTAQSLESISTSSDGTKGILEVMNLIRGVCPSLCKLASTAVLHSDKHVTTVQHNDTSDVPHQGSNNDTSAEDSFDNDVSADDIDDDVNDGNTSESIDADYSAVDMSSGGRSDVSYLLDSEISGPTILSVDGFHKSVQKGSGVSGNTDTFNQSNDSE